MRFFGTASGFSKVSFVLLLVAIGVFCAGLGTANWMKRRSLTGTIDMSIGLWKMVNCSSAYGGSCMGEKLSDTYDTKLLKVTQGLESFGLVLLVLATIVLVFYVTSPTVRIRKVAVAVIVLDIVFITFSVGGMVSWMFNIPANHIVSWSLGLTLCAVSLAILGAILMVPDIRKYGLQQIEKDREKKRMKKLRQKELNLDREKSGFPSKKAYDAMDE